MAVVKLLLKVVIVVDYLIIHDLAVLHDRNDIRVDETSVRFEIEGLITLFYVLVSIRYLPAS